MCPAGMPHPLAFVRSAKIRNFSPESKFWGRNNGQFHILSDSGVGLHFALCEVSQHCAKNQRVIVKDGSWAINGNLDGTQMTQISQDDHRFIL